MIQNSPNYIILREVQLQICQKHLHVYTEMTNSYTLRITKWIISETLVIIDSNHIAIDHHSYETYDTIATQFSLHDPQCIQKTIKWILTKIA